MSAEPATPAGAPDRGRTSRRLAAPHRGRHLIRRLATRALHARLRLRVMLGVVAIVLAALAAFDFAAVTVLRNELLNSTDESLRSVLTVTEPRLDQLIPSVVAIPAKAPTAETPAPSAAVASAHSVLGQYSVAYVSAQGEKVVLESGFGAQQSPLTSSEVTEVLNPRYFGTGVGAGTATVAVAGDPAPLRVSTLRVAGGELVAGSDLGPLDTTLGQIERIIVLGSIGLVLLIAAGVFLVLRRGLRPIESMADQADRITAGDLAERVAAQHHESEVGRLAGALNGMLGRIETSVHERETDQQAMRRFFDDASHELRTPLASLRANAELYLEGALTRRIQIDEVMRRVALETRRMGRLVDDMLRLARLDQQPERLRERIDLTALVVDRVDRTRARDRDRRWKANVEPDLVLTGDGELLGRALDNLLSNVSAHTPEGTWTEVTAERVAAPAAADEAAADGGADGADDGTGESAGGARAWIRITVVDDGNGVAPEALPRLFDRFFRAPATNRQPGSGLGLAIVAEAAASHDGRVEAEDNSPRGLRVIMTLPIRPAGVPDGPAASAASG